MDKYKATKTDLIMAIVVVFMSLLFVSSCTSCSTDDPVSSGNEICAGDYTADADTCQRTFKFYGE